MNDEALVFSSSDVEAFALLSGDSNPIHVDPIAARRSMFGAPVVHGMALVCTALDRALAGRPRAGIAKLSATFSQPLYVGTALDVRVSSGSELELVLESGGERIGSVRARLTDPPHSSIELSPPHVEQPIDLPFEALAMSSGSLELGFDRALLDRLFPSLGTCLAPVQIAELLATTRIVGMRCPGLWSLYAALELNETREPVPSFEYRVGKADVRLNLIDVAVRGPTLHGSLRTFVRPRPELQPDLQTVASAVRPNEFSGMRALVVGGSRGLGELTAKCIAAGGGDVVITYASGARDAERLVEEIRARAIHLDVRSIDEDALRSAGAITHLFYFATPHIPIGRGRSFSQARFTELARFYVTGFAEVVRAVRKLGKEDLVAIYPSTVFLDEMPKGTEEYCAAKAAGEALGISLAKNLPRLRVISPRLPRVRTDQTIGILPVEAEETLPVVLRMLREVRA